MTQRRKTKWRQYSTSNDTQFRNNERRIWILEWLNVEEFHCFLLWYHWQYFQHDTYLNDMFSYIIIYFKSLILDFGHFQSWVILSSVVFEVRLFKVQSVNSLTELRTTELRTNQLSTTKLRTTQLRMTKLTTTQVRKTQLRKGLNFEKDPT